jgi:hypothetical protein
MLHYGISRDDVRGWLFLAAPGARCGKLASDDNGQQVPSTLAAKLRDTITSRKIDVMSLDPFVKAHSAEENSNNAIDGVLQILADMATAHDLAVDVPHHTSKGITEPGNANRGRGASAMKDGARLVYTLSPMSPEEAQTLGVPEADRRRLIRMDSGKVNIAPPMAEAKWFRLVGVPLGNGTERYPHGDEVQTVEPWTPPDTWDGISNAIANAILNEIDAGLPDGNRYSDHHKSTDDRAAWRIVGKHAPNKTEAQARCVVAAWLKSGTLARNEYENPATRKTVKGLFVNPAKRPT